MYKIFNACKDILCAGWDVMVTVDVQSLLSVFWFSEFYWL